MMDDSEQQNFETLRERMEDALQFYGNYASLHEAYAVLIEEVDELFQIVKARRDTMDLEQLRQEAIDIAAVAMRIANFEFDVKR